MKEPQEPGMHFSSEDLRAVLEAYQLVVNASWPDLHPEMARRAAGWKGASAQMLEQELEGYLREASSPGSRVRIFWKSLPGFRFAGFNEPFARDAGLPAEVLRASDDFDSRLPWSLQAAKYRADDEAIVVAGKAKLDIIERQRGSDGTVTWVRVGKAPIRSPRGVIGLFGIYEVLTPDEGRRLFAKQSPRAAL